MRIQTLTLVAGNDKCNAQCPFCVSKMTGRKDNVNDDWEYNGRNLSKACILASRCGATTALITGKLQKEMLEKHFKIF